MSYVGPFTISSCEQIEFKLGWSLEIDKTSSEDSIRYCAAGNQTGMVYLGLDSSLVSFIRIDSS